MNLRKDAFKIINDSIEAVKPHAAVKRAIDDIDFLSGDIYLVSIGKAGFSMAKSASDKLKSRIKDGVVITKYDHVEGELQNIRCFEAGHPILDENSIKATKEAIKLVSNLKENDNVLFLISGGGSALFEDPKISLSELEDINKKLLESGADIVEINTLRKRLSNVKGGRFAEICKPAKVFSIVLSDIIGDPLDMIASGPAYPDSSTKEDALKIIKKYDLKLSEEVLKLMEMETPKELNNVQTMVTGSVKELCKSAEDTAKNLGYKTLILTDELTCQAKEAGSFIGSIARTYKNEGPLAIILGGETVVNITGKGKGGRNQEIALSAALKINGLDNVCVFSVGSDGTDGPTDAAGGIVFSDTMEKLASKKIDIYEVLKNNDSYSALKEVDGLIITGPTGTNVNDLACVLIGKI